MHLGALRTALFNYLYARKHGGYFALRIEDTDQKRLVDGSIEQILRTLNWTNMNHDDYKVQSERSSLYLEHANFLLEHNHAYKCYCTSERLSFLRGGQSAKYDRRCLSLTPEEIQELEDSKASFTIRMKIPPGKSEAPKEVTPGKKFGFTKFEDVVFGKIEIDNDTIDDQIIVKSDGLPTYHLANVVDDHDMNVTHVIRGMEWIPSTPKHVILYNMFGWKPPQFSHLPLLTTIDNQKLSKRHGHASVDWYREQGFLPSALINFVALLGWNPGTDKEVFLDFNELVSSFDIDRVGRGNSVVDLKKLEWLNAQHIRGMIDADIDGCMKTFRDLMCEKIGTEYDLLNNDEYLKKVLTTVKDRMKHLDDFKNFDYFFKPINFDSDGAKLFYENVISKISNKSEILSSLSKELTACDVWTHENIGAAINQCKTNGLNYKQCIQILRYYTSGSSVGASINHMLEALGKKKVIERLQ
ncbi:glutamyl tRS [Acrasis kona]|uniref:glutamate--tRNA ligase n=1 Tax=Acrasis kona TaxID=1008807 RepID=A0AAW2YJJ1_9EUKA